MTVFIRIMSFLWLAVLSQAQQTIQVPTAAFPTIQSAVDAASDGDTVLIASGTYPGGIQVNKAITLSGSGPGSTIIDGNLTTPGIQVALGGGQLARIQGLEITKGLGGCIEFMTLNPTSPSMLELLNCHISMGQRTQGGGVYAGVNANLNLVDCEFHNNGVPFDPNSTTPTVGGAVYANGALTAVDCLFDGNFARKATLMPNSGGGQAGAVFVSLRPGFFERCEFRNNIADSGSCIFSLSFFEVLAPLTVKSCRFIDNLAVERASTIFYTAQGPNDAFEMENCLFSGNTTSLGTSWSLLHAASFRISIVGCTFADNPQASGTETLMNLLATNSMEIRNSIFSNNGTDHLLLGSASTATLTFSNNLTSTSSFSTTGTSHNNIEGVPAAFVDVAGGDFRLLPSSAAVNAGTTGVLDATTDLDGLPRSQLGAPDMGCYELQPGEEDPGAVWAGTVPDLMGGFEDVLLVNGIAGGVGRSVNLSIGTTTTIAVDAAPGTLSSNFIIWGRIGLPGAIEVFPIPFAQGSMAFVPHLLDLGNPSLFTFASSSLPGGIFAAPPAPWSVTGSSLPFPLTITLQGLIETGGGNVRLTNAIAVHNF